MRIALLHPSYWPEVRRGSERLVHDVAVGLSGRGHEVTVITGHPGRPSSRMEEGVRVIRAWRPPMRLLQRLWYEDYLTHAPAALGYLTRETYDVAHAFFGVDARAAVEARRRFGGPPVIFSMNGIPTRQYLVHRRHRMQILLEASAGAAECTVLSRAAAGPFRRYLLREPVVVPGGVFCRSFEATTARSPQPTLICAASLNDPRKRAKLLFEAFAALRRRVPDARLLIAGRHDPARPHAALEPPDGAEWVNADRTRDLAAAYRSAWASVLPSVDEAFGLTLVESLAAGTAAVAARSGASPEILDDETLGRLFDPDDADDLARAMEEALELGRSEAVAAACRERARDYDWSRILPRYEELYAGALEGSGIPSSGRVLH